VTVTQAREVRSARIESVRGLAALLVLGGHIYGGAHMYRPEIYATFRSRALLGGGFGVFLFFTLSGYLLYWPFARRDLATGERIDLRRYAWNRALRILPLYYAVVIVVLVLQEHGGTGEQWWRFLLFAENFSSRTVGRVNGPMWSLVVELHFYALLPVLSAAIAAVARRSPARAAVAVGTLGVVSFAVHRATITHGQTWKFSLPVTFFYFASGMLLAIARVAWERHPPRLPAPVLSASLWLAAAGVLWLAVWWHYPLEPLMAVAGFLVVGACVLPLRPTPLLSLLDWRPLALVGMVSYSLYLWHFPLLQRLERTTWLPGGYFALLAIGVPLCLLVAAVSYWIVEAPFLRFRGRWAPSAPVTITPGDR